LGGYSDCNGPIRERTFFVFYSSLLSFPHHELYKRDGHSDGISELVTCSKKHPCDMEDASGVPPEMARSALLCRGVRRHTFLREHSLYSRCHGTSNHFHKYRRKRLSAEKGAWAPLPWRLAEQRVVSDRAADERSTRRPLSAERVHHESSAPRGRADIYHYLFLAIITFIVHICISCLSHCYPNG
jgi:hypothetical protein